MLTNHKKLDFLKAEIDVEALVSSARQFQTLMQRTQRKCDRTEDILNGLYNFKKEFLATDVELTDISALQSTSTRL